MGFVGTCGKDPWTFLNKDISSPYYFLPLIVKLGSSCGASAILPHVCSQGLMPVKLSSYAMLASKFSSCCNCSDLHRCSLFTNLSSHCSIYFSAFCSLVGFDVNENLQLMVCTQLQTLMWWDDNVGVLLSQMHSCHGLWVQRKKSDIIAWKTIWLEPFALLHICIAYQYSETIILNCMLHFLLAELWFGILSFILK